MALNFAQSSLPAASTQNTNCFRFSQLNAELGRPCTQRVDVNDTSVRNFTDQSSGSVHLSYFYGKTNWCDVSCTIMCTLSCYHTACICCCYYPRVDEGKILQPYCYSNKWVYGFGTANAGVAFQGPCFSLGSYCVSYSGTPALFGGTNCWTNYVNPVACRCVNNPCGTVSVCAETALCKYTICFCQFNTQSVSQEYQYRFRHSTDLKNCLGLCFAEAPRLHSSCSIRGTQNGVLSLSPSCRRSCAHFWYNCRQSFGDVTGCGPYSVCCDTSVDCTCGGRRLQQILLGRYTGGAYCHGKSTYELSCNNNFLGRWGYGNFMGICSCCLLGFWCAKDVLTDEWRTSSGFGEMWIMPLSELIGDTTGNFCFSLVNCRPCTVNCTLRRFS